ncbi:hypothetical protein GGR30_003570 [Martelella radicis]|uniref:Uncharacterized protein n=1 Tax=Martelella radicis TaxID=1397476 RepID=A0A7W6PAR3_9HYPH|nr:hypothetical protein [Martelella radicis]
MAELFLDVALVDFGRRGEDRSQGVTGKPFYPFGLWQLAANAGSKNGLLDQAGNLLIKKTVRVRPPCPCR